jgi:hypothetical protein
MLRISTSQCGLSDGLIGDLGYSEWSPTELLRRRMRRTFFDEHCAKFFTSRKTRNLVGT